VDWPVVVSADGRVITAEGPVTCGHAPRLVARSYARRVTLIFLNPDTTCGPETTGQLLLLPSRVRLPEPLGHRLLTRSGYRARLPYFDERDLAAIGLIPAGFRLAGDFPATLTLRSGQPYTGDTRVYAALARTSALQVTQLILGNAGAQFRHWRQRAYRTGTGCLPDASRAAHVQGMASCRTVAWLDHGYRFILGVACPHSRPFSIARMIALARSVRFSPRQYR
jgi:hypothetical protein